MGPRALPTVDPKLWIDMAKARRSVNLRESEAMAGRCHRDPGMEIRKTPMTSIARFGDTPITTKARTFSTMQTVSITPHLFLKRSTRTPAPMLTRPEPLVRIPRMIPAWKVLRPERVCDSGQENWEAKIVEVRHAMAESQRAEG